jgi:hypothetical protein
MNPPGARVRGIRVERDTAVDARSWGKDVHGCCANVAERGHRTG